MILTSIPYDADTSTNIASTIITTRNDAELY